MIGRRMNPTFYGFPAFSLAVTQMCCDARRDGKYYFLSGFSASECSVVSEASTAVDRKSMGHTVDDLSSN
jgi:hypothetical protein